MGMALLEHTNQTRVLLVRTVHLAVQMHGRDAEDFARVDVAANAR